MATTTLFFSYACGDYKAEPHMQELFEILTRQFCSGTGDRAIKRWLDRERLAWGDVWQKELHRAISDSHLMVALVSPLWLNSEICQAEYAAFLERETELGTEGRILVVEYVSLKNFKPTEGQKEVIAQLKTRQTDWGALQAGVRGDDCCDKCRELVEKLAGKWKKLRAKDPVPGGSGGGVQAVVVPPAAERATGKEEPVSGVPVMSGGFYVPAQMSTVGMISLMFAGRMKVTTELGPVVFQLRSVRLETRILNGKVIKDLFIGASPPEGSVKVDPLPKGGNIQCHELTMMGEGAGFMRGYAPDPHSMHVEFCEAELDGEGKLFLSGKAIVQDVECILVEDECARERAKTETPGCKRPAKKKVEEMQKRMAECLFQKHLPPVQLEASE